MRSKKYLIKGKNILKIFGFNCGVKVTRAFIFFVPLFAFASIAFALSWQDKDWKEAGCPETAIGEWKSEKSDLYKRTSINIQKNKITVSGGNDSKEETFNMKISFQVGEKFVELSLKPVEAGKRIYLKMRPHLITPIRDSGNVNQNSHDCLIKVFQYRSQQHAKFNKYSSWGIYKLKNN